MLKLHSLFTDGVVLQRGHGTKVWGWADAKEDAVVTITVTFAGQTYRTTITSKITSEVTDMSSEEVLETSSSGLNAKGLNASSLVTWSVQLDDLPATSQGQVLKVTSSSGEQVEIRNVVVGDVWLCAGQSNMQLWMSRCAMMFPDVVETAENPHIRYFTVPETPVFSGPETDLAGGKWKAITPKTIPDCSAVGYFFAKELQQKLGVPVGVVVVAIGGTPIKAWLPKDKIANYPELVAELQECQNQTYCDEVVAQNTTNNDSYYAEVNHADIGLQQRWYDTNYDDSNWKSAQICQLFNGQTGDLEQPDLNQPGSIWMRYTFALPEKLAEKLPEKFQAKQQDNPQALEKVQAKLFLGTMVDEDFVYFNGQQIGTTGYRYPPRYYTISNFGANFNSTISDNAKCVLTIRLLNQYGTPDVTASKPLWLVLEDSEGETYTLDLNTEWKYQRGCATSRRQEMIFLTYKPAALYNGMIAPLKQLNLTGIAYYQGESDTNAPQQYSQKFEDLITSWRELFNKTASQLPFIFTQIAYQFYTYDEDWETLRTQQVQALRVDNTGMIFTQDIGEYNDLHPTNKYLVGYRLSRLARKLAYDERIKQTPFEIVGSW